MKIGGNGIFKRVTLKDYLSGTCQYQACEYNDLGACMNEDNDFLNYIEDLSIDIDKNKHKKIICEIEFREDVCIYCGAKMIKVLNRVPYGDTTAVEILYVCPKC